MVQLGLIVVDVPGAICPFTDVPAFERCTSRQDDIGEFRIAFEPDRLVHDTFNGWVTVRFNKARRVRDRSERGGPVAVQHMDLRIAWRRIFERHKLRFHGGAIPRVAL